MLVLKVLPVVFFSFILTNSGMALAQEKAERPAEPALGIGLASTFGPTPVENAAFIRGRISDTLTVNGSLGFRTQSGDYDEGSDFGLGVSGQFAVFNHSDVDFHVIGGLSYMTGSRTTSDTDVQNGVTVTTETETSNSEIALFGGVGAQYFFPSSRRFSLQVDVGPTISLLSAEVSSKTGNVTVTSDASATRLTLMKSLSSGVLFTYWFNK